MTRNLHKRWIGWLALGCLTIALVLQAIAAPTPANARTADSFVNTTCVGTHWSYTDTPYFQRYTEVRQKLVASGIRSVRDSLYQNRAQELGRQGIGMTVVADIPSGKDGNGDTIRQLVNQIKAARAAGARIDAVEGPNEPDLFWEASRLNRKYRGQGFPAGVVAFQRDLYRAIKGDRATAGIKIIGPSLGITYDPGGGRPNPLAKGSLASVVDWGNFHVYPAGNPFNLPFDYNTTSKYYWNSNFPSISIDEHPYVLEVQRAPFEPKPMAITETGYSTYRQGISEKVHAKYMPRLFLEFFRKGFQRACAYELVDEFADREGSNREAHFGLLRHDLSPKPAYRAVQNLIRVLQDPGPAFTPGRLAYELTVSPTRQYREPNSGQTTDYDRTQYLHHVLLQKRDRSFILALWHEISSYDTSANPPREIQPPALPVTLKLNQPIRKATVSVLEEDGSLKSLPLQFRQNRLDLRVLDRVMLVQLVPGR